MIAEHKRNSPTAGDLSSGRAVAEVVKAYEAGGAAAISVITQDDPWKGSLQDLQEAREATSLPILMKCFIVDVAQLYLAKIHGADGVLLIVDSVSNEELRHLLDEAIALDLDPLVEVRSRDDLEVALEFDVDIIGINNRELVDLTIDLETTFDLLNEIPTGKTVVSESGIRARDDIERLEDQGVNAVLVGTQVMGSDDPMTEVRALVGEISR